MAPMRTWKAVARSRLDERLGDLRPLVAAEHRPPRGWIRAIRDALGMPAAELGRRMGVSQSTVVDIERNEEAGTVRLDTLHRAADALDCDLVYFLVPRRDLNDAVRDQALRVARQHRNMVAHHGRLEAQLSSDEAASAMESELVERLIDRRGLWTESQG